MQSLLHLETLGLWLPVLHTSQFEFKNTTRILQVLGQHSQILGLHMDSSSGVNRMFF